MKVIRLLQASLCHRFYLWARSEISPTNPDVGYVLQKEREWSDRLNNLLREGFA